MNVCLTIDFDFFVPEDPYLDLGHEESPFHLRHVWQFRAPTVFEKIKINGNQLKLWDWLEKHIMLPEKGPIYISESHKECFNIAKDSDIILLFDRHHDCWPSHDITCESWCYAWLMKHKQNKIIWIKPDENPEWISPLPDNKELQNCVIETTQKDFPEVLKKEVLPIDKLVLHICRSGCWVPPWLDDDFYDFVYYPGIILDIIQEDLGNALERRWSDEDMIYARQQSLQYKNNKSM